MLLYILYEMGNWWDTSDLIQQAVLLGVLKDTCVSPTPACLHCYLDKAQFGLLNQSLRLPGFGPSCEFQRCCHEPELPIIGLVQPLTTSHSQLLFALLWRCLCPGKCSAALESLFVLCFMWSPLFSPITPVPCSTHWWPSESWNKAIPSVHFAWELCPLFFIMSLFCPMSISMQEVLLYISLCSVSIEYERS